MKSRQTRQIRHAGSSTILAGILIVLRFLASPAIVPRACMLWLSQVRSFQASARLLAVLAVGAGLLTGAVPADAQNNPAPTRFRVEVIRHVSGGDAEVDLTWLYPTGPGATGFTVRYNLSRTRPNCNPTPTDPEPDSWTAGGGDRRITIPALDRENFACFWIQADFAGGNASDWTLVEPAPIDLRDETPIGTIPAPQRPRVRAGDARVTIQFTAQEIPDFCTVYIGGVEEVTNRWYYTRRLEGEQFGDNPEDTVEVTSLYGTDGRFFPAVQNIENGKSYVFKIRLRCISQTGPISPWSEESDVVTPRSVAEEITEPQQLSVVPVRVAGRDTAALRVTWGHPSSGPPDRYRLQYYRGARDTDDMGSPWTSVTLPGTPPSYDITGLTFNSEYQIRLRAESEDARPDCGNDPMEPVPPCGPWATVSGNTGGANRPPVAVDDLEPIVLEVGTTRAVDVAHFFSDPDGDLLTFTAFSQNSQVATVAVSGSTVTITAVAAGSATVSVSATDPSRLSARIGIEITVEEEQLAAVPTVPVDVEAFIGPNGPAMLWEPPAPVAGAVVTGYDVSWRDNVNRAWNQTVRVDGGAEARTWVPMITAVPGRTYEFRVRAVSATGPGPWSAPAMVAAPELLTPSTPLDVEAFIGTDGPAVLWEPPAPVAGAEIIRYDVSWRTDIAPVWTDHTPVIGGPNARTWAPRVAAVPGRTYEFRVRAVSAAGPGPWSTPATITAPELQTPSAPPNLRLVSDGPDLFATWDEPADIASIPVSGYELRFRGTSIDDRWRTIDVPAGTLAARIPASHGIVRGGTYRAQVRALGAGGPGPWSDEVENLDLEPATVEIIDENPPAYAHNGPFRVTFRFSEPVSDFDGDDIHVVPGTIQEMTGQDNEYQIVVDPDGSGNLRIQIRSNAFQDANGNWNPDQIEANFPIDTIPPTATITTDARTPVAGYFEIEIAFHEPVSNLTKEDIVYVNGNGWTPLFRQDTDQLYTVGVRPLTSGRVHLRVPQGAAIDRADNPNTAADFSISAYIQDNSGGPQVQLTTTTSAPVTGTFPIDITFSETVTGLDLDDLVVGNGQATNLEGSNATYTARITPATTGTVTVDMPKGAVHDVIGNPNQVAPTFRIEAVVQGGAGPRVLITTTAIEPVTGPFPINITFSAAVTGLTVGDLHVGNGSPSRLRGTASAYTAMITPTMTGTVTVDIPAGAARDANDTPSQAAARLSIEAMTPVPALPAAAAAILGLTLALAGRRARRRRRAYAVQSHTNPGPIPNQ